MALPDYKGGSIVNLMSSIEKSFGGRPKYPVLRSLEPKSLKSKNTILIVVDGMGYNFLMKHGKNTLLKENIKSKITSTFPSTTASAAMMFYFGVPAQQHGLTGWHVYLKEIGMISTPLPYITKYGKFPLSKVFDPKKMYNQKSFYEKIRAKSYVILDKSILNSETTKAVVKKAKKIRCSGINGMFRQILNVSKKPGRKFIYAYTGELDGFAHDRGVESRQSLRFLRKFDRLLKNLKSNLEDSTVIITSDHGLVDVRKIDIEHDKKFMDCLSMPLSGDARAVYCFVRPSKVKEFERHVKTRLSRYCELHRSEDILRKNYFGLFKPNPQLRGRIGDYTLIFKKNYSPKSDHVAEHAGTSEDEMYVPLIILER